MAIVATLSWGAPSPDCRIHEGPVRRRVASHLKISKEMPYCLPRTGSAWFSCGCDAPSSPVPTRSKNAGLMQWTHAQPHYQG